MDKNELDLNSKCDKNEMNQIISDLKKLINTKASNEQVNQLLNDKITKNEVLFYLSNKPSIDDINTLLQEKIGMKELEEVLNQINIIKDEKTDIDVFNSEIQEIKEILENKSNSIDVINALETKVDKDELNIQLKNLENRKEINNLLEEKKDKIDYQKIYEIVNDKLNDNESKNIEKIENILKEKADSNDFNLIKDAFQDMKINMTQKINDIDNDLDRLIENIKTQFKSMSEDMKNLQKNIYENSNIENINSILKNKIDLNDLDQSMNLLKTNIFQSMNSFMKEVEENQKNFEEKISTNLDKILKENKDIIENINFQNTTVKDLFKDKNNNYDNEVNDLKFKEITKNISNYKLELKKDMENIVNVLNNKIDIDAVNEEITKFENKTENKINALNESQDNIISQVNNKIKEMYEDLSKEIANKITIADAKFLLTNETNNNSNLNNSLCNYQSTDDIKNELKKKLDINIFNKVVNQFNLNFENIKKDINSTNESKELNKSLHNKVAIEHFNKLISEINKKLNEKVNTTDFTSSLDNQSLINDTLCSENIIGRWLWKSRNIKNNYLIPWESQTVNTSPDNFIWEKDKTFILVNEEGLYELNLGFYSDKKPSIQVLINGEIIINSQNNIINKKIGGKNGDENNIIGLSVIEFIMVKKQSKISVVFYGGKGTGFIGLKKL